MKEGINVTGLNTAATLWGSAAVGACAGASLVVEAALAAVFVLAGNTLLRPVVNHINRRTVSETAGEATYHVYAMCKQTEQAQVHEQLLQLLEAAHYPVRAVQMHPFGTSDTEIEAVLYATAVNASELDGVMQHIEGREGVLQAYWHAGAENT